jgi:hypothetical protein
MADEVSVSSPAAGSEADGNAPRRSGRAVRKPISLVEQQSAAKRKRAASGAQDADGDIDMDDDDEDESDEDEESEDQDDDERPKPKRARKSGKSTGRKSNGASKTLPVRSAKPAGPKKPRTKKTARFSSAEDAGGLYSKFSVLMKRKFSWLIYLFS